MTTTLHSSRFHQKNSVFATGLSLLALVGLLAPSLARADVIVSVDKGQTASEHKTSGGGVAGSSGTSGNSGGNSGGGGKGGKGGKGGSSGGSTSNTFSNSTFYTITVRNLADAPVKGVVVEYHVYNKTTTSGGGQSSVSLDDITDSITLDLDANEVKTIETKDVPHVVTNTTGGGGGGGGKGKGKGGGSAAASSSSVQDVMGWVVYLEFHGKKVHTYQGPTDDVIEKAAQYLKPNN